MKQILYKRARTVIRNWGDKFVSDLKRQLNVDKTVASGRTRNSIEGKFKADEQFIRYQISSRDVKGVPVLSVIDTGRKPGGRPPINAILEWIQRKGIQRRDARGR